VIGGQLVGILISFLTIISLPNVMPAGDSITHGLDTTRFADPLDPLIVGYRGNLYGYARSAGMDFNYIGSQSSGDGTLPNHSHEGNNGFTNAQIQARLATSIPTYKPNIILLMGGTNDISRGDSGATVADAMKTLLESIYTADKSIVTLVAPIPPFSSAGDYNTRRGDYNALLPGVIQTRQMAGQFVRLAPMGTVSVVGDHPDPAGYVTIAQGWWAALQELHGTDPAFSVGSRFLISTSLVSTGLQVTITARGAGNVISGVVFKSIDNASPPTDLSIVGPTVTFTLGRRYAGTISMVVAVTDLTTTWHLVVSG
jgi:lysophospholipase L1-like esterase